MACCRCCCGNVDCTEGQQGKCCCGGVDGECCPEGEYCCSGQCQPSPCEGHCCLPDNTCSNEYETQEDCEECVTTYECYEYLSPDPEEECPEGWSEGEGFCYRITEVESCEECEGECTATTTGPCGTWVTYECEEECPEGEYLCECRCEPIPCQAYTLSGVATNCVGQTCTWGPRPIDVSLACGELNGQSGLAIVASVQVPADGCGPQANNDGAECWPCTGAYTTCDEPPEGPVSFGALLAVYAYVECECDYATSVTFDSYVELTNTRFDSTTVSLVAGECE